MREGVCWGLVVGPLVVELQCVTPCRPESFWSFKKLQFHLLQPRPSHNMAEEQEIEISYEELAAIEQSFDDVDTQIRTLCSTASSSLLLKPSSPHTVRAPKAALRLAQRSSSEDTQILGSCL